MSSGFVTESEAAEARKIRQEQWEKVRSATDPVERPEEPFDGRSLFDRLKENKMKKDMEYEEAHKLKNLIRGLDDDEVQFLELVDQSKMDQEAKQMREEEQELKDFRNRVATLQEESVDKKIQSELKLPKSKTPATAASARPSQKSLLGVGIKRKNGEVVAGGSSTKVVATTTTPPPEAAVSEQPPLDKETTRADVTATGASLQSHLISTTQFDRGQLQCAAILPGIGPYTCSSSDSEMSSGSDDEPDAGGRYDLCGRKRKKKQCGGD